MLTLKYILTLLSNALLFFVGKNVETFFQQKYQYICHVRNLTFEILTKMLSNDLNFEQPAPEFSG